MIKAKKFLRRGAGYNEAGLQQDDARGEQEGFAQIVRDEDDGFAKAVGQGAKFALKFGTGDGIERAERLVHQKNRRIGGEGTRDPHTLALAARKFVGAAMRKFVRIEANQQEHFLDAGGRARDVPFLQSGHEGYVLGDREMGEEAGFLDDVTNAATEPNGVPIGGGAGLDEDFPMRGKQHSNYQLEKGGLAAAAAAEEDECLALWNH